MKFKVGDKVDSGRYKGAVITEAEDNRGSYEIEQTIVIKARVMKHVLDKEKTDNSFKIGDRISFSQYEQAIIIKKDEECYRIKLRRTGREQNLPKSYVEERATKIEEINRFELMEIDDE